LVTTLTKKMAEDLTDYLLELGVRVRYLHSEVDTLRRVELLRQLRLGEFDVLVGINLLREGLDLPEVSLVAILDADKEGFLRSGTSLIQLMGRAARNVNGKVIMYADTMTPAMQNAIDETDRRRVKQLAYNQEHGITPTTIQKAVRRGLAAELRARKTAREAVRTQEPEFEIDELIREMEEEMLAAAKDLAFEKAAMIRDQVMRLRRRKEEAQRTGAPTKARRSDVDSTGSGRRQRPEGKAGMPGVRSGRRRKGM